MFEVTGEDIARLSDGDLRSLIVRLARSELRAQGLPVSAVTAGGHQDAPDGGLDVRVECPSPLVRPDFVPRAATGFQVKKPDMPASKIRDEMRPEGALRPVIGELANAGGAYVIVSAQGSVADGPLRERRAAMREQLADLEDPERLATDFYDRDRLAAWVNEYPGTAAWVRSRVDRALDGWGPIDSWGGASMKNAYLADPSMSLLDETAGPSRALPIIEGIDRLRSELARPGRCVRLIGLSGLGKTRLVQALFEADIGSGALDPGLAVYTDYSTETRPTARDLARALIARGQPTALIVDNCNPQTHGELAKLCVDSPISLLTVEYDVREDEPEHTEVFRLQAASSDVLEKWLAQDFAHVSQVDRATIAELSSGNFRVARALAETLRQGETLGRVKGQELFERIFRQRNADDKSLLLAAQDIALAYSIDGTDMGSDGELASVGALRATPLQQLFEALAELQDRGVVQSRGRWRAILPQAIANSLATNALKRIPPDVLDRMIEAASPRLRKSVSRRLGNLHDSPAAGEASTRWLEPTGPFGDLLAPAGDSIDILTNLAPLAPAHVLSRIADTVARHPEIKSEDGPHRWGWIRLIKALAFEQEQFPAAADLLLQFLVAEPRDNRGSSAKDAFAELFHIVLSGTMATPAQRRALVREWLDSSDADTRERGLIALRGLLQTGHFSSTSTFDFGARSRSYGWQPRDWRERQDWYVQTIALCLDYDERFPELRAVLASHVRGLWHFPACRDALEAAATTLLAKGAWIEAWIALRTALRFDGAQMPPEVRAQLEALIDRTKPRDLLHRARAAVLGAGTDGWDISDGESDDGGALSSWEKAELMAVDVGRALANDSQTRRTFMPEVMSRAKSHQHRAFSCGRGIAEAASDLDGMWASLLSDLETLECGVRDVTILGGFLERAARRDRAFSERVLDEAMSAPLLIEALPYLQARVAVDAEGIARLRQVIAAGTIDAGSFLNLANGSVEHAPPVELGELLQDLSRLPDGDIVAIDILHMYFFANRQQSGDSLVPLVETGRDIVAQLSLSRVPGHRMFGLADLIRRCLAGEGVAREAALAFATRLREDLESDVSYYEASEVIGALCEIQPRLVLDTFVLAAPDDRAMWRWDVGGCKGLPFKGIGSEAILEWAAVEPQTRYPLLGSALPLFSRGDFDESAVVDPMFKTVLVAAPDKRAFLGRFDRRIYPRSYSGSWKGMLEARRLALAELAAEMPSEVATWINEGLPVLDRSIQGAIEMEADREESFE